MTISQSKIKGMLAVCLMMAIIPFIRFLFHLFPQYDIPVAADQCNACLAIEIADADHNAGVYFIPPGTTVNRLLQSAGVWKRTASNFRLKTGMKLIIDSSSENQNITVTEMSPADRLSLGMPIDINKATEDDLLLIRGIGQATAQRILDLRKKINRFEDVKQLMEIKGIKEKRLAEIKPYLYVEKHSG